MSAQARCLIDALRRYASDGSLTYRSWAGYLTQSAKRKTAVIFQRCPFRRTDRAALSSSVRASIADINGEIRLWEPGKKGTDRIAPLLRLARKAAGEVSADD